MAGSQPLRWALVFPSPGIPTMWQNWSVSSLSLITIGTVVGTVFLLDGGYVVTFIATLNTLKH